MIAGHRMPNWCTFTNVSRIDLQHIYIYIYIYIYFLVILAIYNNGTFLFLVIYGLVVTIKLWIS